MTRPLNARCNDCAWTVTGAAADERALQHLQEHGHSVTSWPASGYQRIEAAVQQILDVVGATSQDTCAVKVEAGAPSIVTITSVVRVDGKRHPVDTEHLVER